MSDHQRVSLGRVVLYTLTVREADEVNRRRDFSANNHYGNKASPGDVYPMVIVKVWDDQSVNGQVHLDGNDLHWVTSVTDGIGGGHWTWPERV